MRLFAIFGLDVGFFFLSKVGYASVGGAVDVLHCQLSARAFHRLCIFM
jgi:hypothetical protein